MIRNRRRGANALEFALVLPVLLLLLMGVAEYSWVFSRAMTIDAAARQAVRVAASTEADDVARAAENSAYEYLEEADPGADYEIVASLTGVAPVRHLQLRVTRTYDPLTGLVPAPGELQTSYSQAIRSEL